jgi:hypothetical protein
LAERETNFCKSLKHRPKALLDPASSKCKSVGTVRCRDRGCAMVNGTNPISDQTQIGGTESHDILFRVAAPGMITIYSSVPAHHPTHSDSGVLGWIILRRPGSSAVLKRKVAQLTDSSITVQYQATAADAAVFGNWTCEVDNGLDSPIVWTTTISGPITSIPLASASFDLGLLNLLLKELTAIAALSVHLQSSADQSQLSNVSWSPALATLLGGLTGYPFHLDDEAKSTPIGDIVFRITNLDSDPDYPTLVLSGDPLSLTATMRFLTDGIRLVALDWPVPDITLSFFEVSLELTFDGNIHPTCQAVATLQFNSMDVSGDVESGVIDALNKRMHGDPQLAQYFAPDQVRAYIDGFVTRLLRLGAQSIVRAYRSDGQSLIVDYSPPGQ